ncbi:MAG: hypothetical protein MPW15_11350 [Candidatus Manganitrophus sp.]|nr:hypothetical protein [Candidatus Manganitrophus sp.]
MMRESVETSRSFRCTGLSSPRTSRGGEGLYYVYADPTICRCIYFGDEEAYREYRRLALDRRLSDQRPMEAKPDQRVILDWGVWGEPGWWLG